MCVSYADYENLLKTPLASTQADIIPTRIIFVYGFVFRKLKVLEKFYRILYVRMCVCKREQKQQKI